MVLALGPGAAVQERVHAGVDPGLLADRRLRLRPRAGTGGDEQREVHRRTIGVDVVDQQPHVCPTAQACRELGPHAGRTCLPPHGHDVDAEVLGLGVDLTHGRAVRVSVGRPHPVEQLRQIAAELKLADVRSQVVLSAFTDFDYTGLDPADPSTTGVFTPDPRHTADLESLLGEVIAWSDALADVRAAVAV